MFRHYRVIFRDLVFGILPSYISISIAAVGNTISIDAIDILMWLVEVMNMSCLKMTR